MPDLVLSPAQVELVVMTGAPVPVRDEEGKLVGYLSPVADDPDFSPEDIEEAKAILRKRGPRRTLSEIIERLKSTEVS